MVLEVAAAGSVVKLIFGLAFDIKDAANTAKRNKKECRETAERASLLLAALSSLLGQGHDDTETQQQQPAEVVTALESLRLASHEALRAIMKCQQDGAIARLFKAGKRSRVLRQVNKNIKHRMIDVILITALQTNRVVRQNIGCSGMY